MIEPMHLEPLRVRKAQIEKRLSDLDARAAKIAKEREDLEAENAALGTTLTTLARVYGIDVDEETVTKAAAKAASTKPEAAPTLFEMVTKVLNDWDILAEHHEGQEIYDEIKKRWWPDAPRNSIIPSLWRFANEGRLVKAGTKYGLLPKNETPGAGTPGASVFEADLDDEIPF